ncbi:MAG TPA: prepilin peptidase [Jatrophihabitantaceae bacterium]|jgi:leader peptidase (prepilin peptidase)/N-methyltransferase|nr:prepilin peptidase [Jatrophihabitantaceae bacterium]
MAIPMLSVYMIAGLFGLVIGSFLNVVIYRLPREESLLFPHSHCPSCRTPIKRRHNIPVLGWLALRGRCASCAVHISVRYPLVEIITAALFVAVTARFGVSAALPAYLYLAAITVTLAMIDFDVRRLPDSIVLPSYVIGALVLMPAGVADADWWSAYRGLIAMAALLSVYFAFSLAYPASMELAQVKLAGLLGLYLGYMGWGTVLIGTFGGFALSGGVGAVMLAAGRGPTSPLQGTQRNAPFGAYMITAALLALFVATPITTWYSSLLTSM